MKFKINLLIIIIFSTLCFSCSKCGDIYLEENEDIIIGGINKAVFFNDIMYLLDNNNNIVIYNNEGKMIDRFTPEFSLSDSIVKYNRMSTGNKKLISQKEFFDNIGWDEKKNYDNYYKPVIGDFSIINDSLMLIAVQINCPAKKDNTKFAMMIMPIVFEFNRKSKVIRNISIECIGRDYFQAFAICSDIKYIYGSCITEFDSFEYNQKRSLITKYNMKGDFLETEFYFTKEIDNEFLAYPRVLLLKSFLNEIWVALGNYPKIFCSDSSKNIDLVINDNNRNFFKLLSFKSEQSDSIITKLKTDPTSVLLDPNNINIRVMNF